MSELKSALTAEEWAKGDCWRDDAGVETHLHHHANRTDKPLVVSVAYGGFAIIERNVRHALAALCLHNQPFGFTREDVEMLRVLHKTRLSRTFRDELAALADRLEALLPPETD